MKYITSPIIVLITVFSLQGQDEFDENFQTFWESTIKELNTTTLQFESVYEENTAFKKVELVKIKSIGNVYYYLWQSTPLEGDNFPVRIKFSGFGKGNDDMTFVPNDNFMNLKNTICIKVDIRGQGLSTDQIKFDGFLNNGLKSKESYIYRGAFMDAVRAVDYASLIKKANGDIIVFGGSQGGLLSLVATALNSKVDLCVANFPFFADIEKYKKSKWPLNMMLSQAKKESLSEMDVMGVLRYFDLISFAKLIKTPVLMCCGSSDDITPYEGALEVYSNLKSVNKLFHVVSCKGHGCISKFDYPIKIQEIFLKQYFKN